MSDTFDRDAELGTPENPEIILPKSSGRAGSARSRFRFKNANPRGEANGARPASGPAAESFTSGPVSNRFSRAVQILSWMLSLSLPAIILDSICFWLLEAGRSGGGLIPWLLLLLFIVPAALATLFAVAANAFLALLFFANLLGKPMTARGPGFVRFIRIR